MMNVNFPKKEHIYCDLLCRYEKRCTFVVTKTQKKLMKRVLSILLVVALFMAGCTPDNGGNENVGGTEGTALTVSLEQPTRTSLGTNDNNGVYPTYWSIGDQVAVNGVLSDKVTADEHNKPTATFEFADNSIVAPYNVTYPYCSLTSAEKSYVEFSAEQSYTEGHLVPKCMPMCGYAEKSGEIVLHHLSAILHLPIKAVNENVDLKEVVITSNSGAKLSGIFKVDCQNISLSATGSCSSSLTYTFPKKSSLLTAEISDLFIAIPAGEIGNCTIEIMDTSGEKMTATWSPSEALPRGVVQEFNTIFYEKGASCELELRDMSTPTFQVFAKSDEIKVMSFNVRTTLTETNTANNWDNRKGACVTLIKEHMPSFIGVQEAKYNAHWTYLKDQLAADYDGYGVSRDTGKESGSGETMGILYNRRVVEMIDCGTFWLSETPEVPSKGWGANYSRCATWGLFKHKTTGKKICYINTHIDHESAQAKIEGMKLVSRFFQQYRKDDYLLLLTADFNMVSTHEAMDVIESYMHNTREVAPEELTDYDTTFNGFKTGKDSIIDHIYCSNYLKVVEYHTIDEDYGVSFVSDHYPIYSIIKIE